MLLNDAIVIDPADMVAVALRPIAAGERIDVGGARVVAREAIGFGHKLARRPIAAGEPVLKYGHPIGRAAASIEAGAHVHSHNLRTLLDAEKEYGAAGAAGRATPTHRAAPGFQGYRRADGRVATRNEIWVLPTVGCVGRTAERIAAIADARHRDRIDGVHAFTHPHGCSQLGDDLSATRDLLASLACNPNAAGVLLVGLGCESNQLDLLLERVPADRRGQIRVLRAQSSADEIAEGVGLIDELADAAATARREPVGLDGLVLGLKCGGSDALSGLTANPLVGRMADRVVDAGGRAVLTEIPEIFGAEQLLMARAADARVHAAIGDLVNRFKRHFLDHGEPVSENPSPGNIAGGITTLEEKSLGAVQKGGHATVVDVRDYAGRVSQDGLTLLEAPGNDAVSCTALAAAGATAILFTTGRGTPLGFPVPTVKIASNARLAEAKPRWIDFDAGAVLDGGLDVAADALLARIVAIASGERTAAERAGERSIAIWRRGVTL